MKTILFIFTILLFSSCNSQNTSSMNNDFSPYPRVREAYGEKENIVKQLLIYKNIDTSTLNIFIRAFKTEKIAEVWGKNTTNEKYQLITTYDVCKSSGGLGPKRREGDYQVPEGFYHIDRFNPKSTYHLSLGINYPNASDKILSDKDAPGSDIFIHGQCVTVGCLPMTDDKIKEIYLFAEFAKRSGQDKIPVHIFPFHLIDKNISKDNTQHQDFWRNLKGGYEYFENNHTIPIIQVDNQGKYLW